MTAEVDKEIEQKNMRDDGTQAAPPDAHARVEAILFAAGVPVRYEAIAESLGISEDMLRRILAEMQTGYEGRGIELVLLDDVCQLCTRAIYEGCVRTALGMKPVGVSMSAASLETLAIVAYRQPVTRAYIEQVRGVDCSYSISVLCDRHMIEATGRLDVPGRPLLYETTDDFLRTFGLTSLSQLPSAELFEKADSGNGEEDAEESPENEEKDKTDAIEENAPGTQQADLGDAAVPAGNDLPDSGPDLGAAPEENRE